MLLKKAPAYPAFMSLASMLLTLDETKANPNSIDKKFRYFTGFNRQSQVGEYKRIYRIFRLFDQLCILKIHCIIPIQIPGKLPEITRLNLKMTNRCFSFCFNRFNRYFHADTLVIKMKKGVFIHWKNVWIGKTVQFRCNAPALILQITMSILVTIKSILQNQI